MPYSLIGTFRETRIMKASRIPHSSERRSLIQRCIDVWMDGRDGSDDTSRDRGMGKRCIVDLERGDRSGVPER